MCRSTTCCRASLGTMRLSSSLHPTPPSRSRASTSSVCVCVCGVHVCIVVSVYACVRSSFARHTQGWQGRGGSPTRAPRPATPGEISDPRPATPSDPGLPARPGHTRSGPDIPGPTRTFVRIGILILFFDCNIRECLQ